MDTTEANSVRLLSSTDGEAVPEIVEQREDAAQAEQSVSASHDSEVDVEELEATARHSSIARICCGTHEGDSTRPRTSSC